MFPINQYVYHIWCEEEKALDGWRSIQDHIMENLNFHASIRTLCRSFLMDIPQSHRVTLIIVTAIFLRKKGNWG